MSSAEYKRGKTDVIFGCVCLRGKILGCCYWMRGGALLSCAVPPCYDGNMKESSSAKLISALEKVLSVSPRTSVDFNVLAVKRMLSVKGS
jgi:hypothetical protein